MTDPRLLLSRALVGFGERLATATADDWKRPTPCSGWTVHDLVAHVVEEERWGPPLLAGEPAADIGERLGGDLLGDAPVDAWQNAAQELQQAISRPEALTNSVHLPGGAQPARAYLLELFADHLIHTWDLARATDGDERLAADLVGACAAWFDQHEQAWRDAGAIGPRATVSPDADAQTDLLARFGRDTRRRLPR